MKDWKVAEVDYSPERYSYGRPWEQEDEHEDLDLSSKQSLDIF